MAQGRLAQTTFSAGPNDSLASVNVYKATTNEVVNSVQDLSQRYDFSLLSSVRGGDYLKAASPIVTGLSQGAAVIDQNSLIARMVSASKAGLGTMRSLGSSALDALSGAMDGGKEVMVSIGGVISSVAGSAYDDLAGLGKLIGEVTGTSDLFTVNDKEGVAGLYSGIIEECRNLGIRGAFQMVTSSITDPYLMNSIVNKSLDNIIATTDQDSLIGIALNTTKGVVQAVNPNAISDYARKYTYPLNQKIGDVTYGHQELFGAFDTIDDVWDRYDRIIEAQNQDGETTQQAQRAIDLTKMQNGSDDFKQMIRAANDTEDTNRPQTKFYQLASVYNPVDVYSAAKVQFPYAALQGNA